MKNKSGGDFTIAIVMQVHKSVDLSVWSIGLTKALVDKLDGLREERRSRCTENSVTRTITAMQKYTSFPAGIDGKERSMWSPMNGTTSDQDIIRRTNRFYG